MSAAYLSFCLGVAAFVCHAVIAIFAVRKLPQQSPVMLHIGSAVLAELIFVGLGHAAPQPVSFWHGAILIGFGALAFLFIFSALYKSVSIRMLLIADQAGGAEVTMLTRDFTQAAFTDRAYVLKEMGCVTEADGRFTITPEGVRLARKFSAMKALMRVSTSGLYN